MVAQCCRPDECFILVGPAEAAEQISPHSVDKAKGKDAEAWYEVDIDGANEIANCSDDGAASEY